MATAMPQESICSLVEDGTLELQTEALRKPEYNGVVVTEDTLLVINKKACNFQVYSRRDGKLMSTSSRLVSNPMGVCLISKTEVAVCLSDSTILILSLKSIDDVKLVKTLDVRTGFDPCHSVAKLNSDKLVVSGREDYDIIMRDYMLCWCVVNLTDGRVVSKHMVCYKHGSVINSHLAVKNNTVYLSCWSLYNSTDDGVYAYDIFKPHTPKFLYQHRGFEPYKIMVDVRNFIYVCDTHSSSIHQLTDSGQLVTIHTLSSKPYGIFYDDQYGVLYTTRRESSVITVYRLEYSHQSGTGIPIEIMNMDDRSIQLFENALKDGKEKVYSIRVMVVGHLGVGKTTLIKRLLGKDVNISERCSTEGIDVHLHCCDVSLSSSEWTLRKKDSEQDYRLQRLVKVLNEKQVTRNEAVDDQQVVIPHEGERTHISTRDHIAEEPYHRSPQPDVIKDLPSTVSQQVGFPSSVMQRNLPKSDAHTMVRSEPGENVSTESHVKDPMREMLQLLQKNVDKLKDDLGKYAPLTMWDFAGQYAFYTTHQMFLSRRAIYLLVSDISGHVDDWVEDECFFDRKGIMKCRVHELVAVWLNSIHSCAQPNKENMTSGAQTKHVIPPPVILVGTHVDAIRKAGKQEQTKKVSTPPPKPVLSTMQSKVATKKGSLEKTSQQRKPKPVKPTASSKEKKGAKASTVKGQTQVVANTRLDEPKTEDYPHEVCESYFREIRSHLKDKPSRFHLVEEDFAIDNTVVDSKLEDLKKKIVEVATRQPYWGEEIPARWLPLEQALMNFRAKGLKVIHRSLLVNISQAGGVQISTDELDLFLRFQHEIGTILYFSTELLKEKIVLDPQWMINALKSLITAEMFVLRNTPSVSAKWFEFKNGKLSSELIDALWTKDKNADLHDNKEHILLLMEELNIIAKPKLYIEAASEVKEVNYFLAPCMLHEETPREVICPEPHPQMESSSVMCYVFTGKFLPAPIFHRLLAACVAHWPLATRKTETTLKNQIFCGCGVFQLDQYHKLTLHFWDYIIYMRVTKMGITDRTPSSKLCIEVKEFIAKILNKIIGYLGHSLKFEEFIQCPEYNGESVNSLIPVSLLKENAEVHCDFHDNIIESNKFLKFWFEGQGVLGESETRTAATSRPPKPFELPTHVSSQTEKVSSLPFNMQTEKPSERQMGRLSMKIGHEFFRLGLELGLSGAVIQQIQMNYHDTATQCLKILIKWKEQCGDKATFGNLEKAFISVGIDVDVFNSVDTAGDTVSCLPPAMLDKQPNDIQLNRICSQIGTEHVHLGVELEVPFSRIDQILAEHKGNVHRQCFEIMKEWKQSQTRPATFRNLQQAFRCLSINPDILKENVN